MELATDNAAVGPKQVTKEVWAIVEREGLQKPLWLRIGSAWENRDGSMRVILNAMPFKGDNILIRDPRPFDELRRPAVLPVG